MGRKKREEVDDSIIDSIVLVEEELEDDEYSIYNEGTIKFETEITDLIEQESEQAFIYKDVDLNLTDEQDSDYISSTTFQDFRLVIPKKEVIDLKKNIFGPITNIYTYKPILFNLIIKNIEDLNQNSEICFSNCLEICYKYEELLTTDYKEKIYCLFLFFFYLSICHGNDKYLSTSKYHIKKDDSGFQFYEKGVFKTKVLKKKLGKDSKKN